MVLLGIEEWEKLGVNNRWFGLEPDVDEDEEDDGADAEHLD